MQKDNRQDVTVSDLWTKHQRAQAKTTQSFACVYCPDRKILSTSALLREHAKTEHADQLPDDENEAQEVLKFYEAECLQKK